MKVRLRLEVDIEGEGKDESQGAAIGCTEIGSQADRNPNPDPNLDPKPRVYRDEFSSLPNLSLRASS